MEKAHAATQVITANLYRRGVSARRPSEAKESGPSKIEYRRV